MAKAVVRKQGMLSGCKPSSGISSPSYRILDYLE